MHCVLLPYMNFSSPIYSILYVDSSKENLERFEKAFSREYFIHSAGSGKKGLEIMEQKTIQLVISDQQLPDMDGMEFLELVRYRFPESMRMILAGKGEKETILSEYDRGNLYRYVTKPWTGEDLKMSIDNAMELYNLKIQNRNLVDAMEDATRNLEHKVMARTREIERQKANITDSLIYASRIQNALMLPPEELTRLLPDHFVLNKPKDIVSGDFYWVARKNGLLIIAVADCTGHGVPGAFMSILGISFLNEIVTGRDDPRPNEILNSLRSQIIKALGQSGRRDETKEGMEMALCTVDLERKKIQFSGAFRPMYLISDGKLKVIRGDRMPVGIYWEERGSFSNKELSFSDSDIIYLFTDGYVDQIGGLERKTFKSVRFRKLLREICHKPLEEQRAILREEHEIWRAGQEQIDDILVLGVGLRKQQDFNGQAIP